MFGWATIRLGIGPHSSLYLYYTGQEKGATMLFSLALPNADRFSLILLPTDLVVNF